MEAMIWLRCSSIAVLRTEASAMFATGALPRRHSGNWAVNAMGLRRARLWLSVCSTRVSRFRKPL